MNWEQDFFRLPFPLSETLFLSDLDGTLLNLQAGLNKEQTKQLQILLDHPELHFSVATARELASVFRVLPQTRFTLPLVTANGSFLVDARSGKILLGRYLKQENLQVIRNLIEATEIRPVVFCHDEKGEHVRWIRENASEGVRFFTQKLIHDPRAESLSILEEDFLWQGDVFCLNFMDRREKLQGLYKQLCDLDCFYLIFHQELYRPEWWLSVYPKGVSKGAMAQELQKRLNLKHLVVFGDQSNDIPLFEAADLAYAVANAEPCLDPYATARLPWSNEEGAVLHFLEKILKNTSF